MRAAAVLKFYKRWGIVRIHAGLSMLYFTLLTVHGMKIHRRSTGRRLRLININER
jgi:hypothetical protein